MGFTGLNVLSSTYLTVECSDVKLEMMNDDPEGSGGGIRHPHSRASAIEFLKLKKFMVGLIVLFKKPNYYSSVASTIKTLISPSR